MAALLFDSHLISQYRSRHVKSGTNVLSQNSRILRSVQQNYVSANFALQFRWSAKRNQIPFVHDR